MDESLLTSPTVKTIPHKPVSQFYTQIEQTIGFEFKRNGMRLLSMILTSIGIYALFLAIQLIRENQGAPVPDDPADYFQNYLTMINFLILIITSTFGGSIIVEDFEKETGNLLFPKITKGRLLIGRIIARYVYIAISIVFFYLLVAITTWIKYDGIPKIVWGSMGWALFYAFLVFSLMILFSSMFKRTATATVMGLLTVLIIFQLLSLILMFTGTTIEPFFILTYYSNIITAWFDMPAVDERYAEIPFNHGPGANLDITYRQWVTPSVTGAILGMVLYSAILLIGAYLIYRRRQN